MSEIIAITYRVEARLARTLRIGSAREGWTDSDTFVKGTWCIDRDSCPDPDAARAARADADKRIADDGFRSDYDATRIVTITHVLDVIED